MKRTFLIAVAVIITTTMNSQNSNFSGTWKLNSELSKLNAEFTMAPSEIIIGQKDNDMTVEKHSSFQGENFTINEKFTLDGKECINEGWQGSEKKSTAVWSADKNSLTVTTKLIMGDGGEMTLSETYKMDKKNMIISTKGSSSYGEFEEAMVYEKQ